MSKKLITAGKFLLFIISFIFIAFIATTYQSDIDVETLKEKWTYPESKFIDVDGMSVHYRRTGKGFPIILIHGTGASLHTWEEWTKALNPFFEVISLDIPAFGLTGPHPSADYSLESYAKFLEAFTNKLGIEQFHVAGNSLGGGIAWKYTSMYPDKVDRLILVNASGYPLDKEDPLAFRLAKSDLWAPILLKCTPKSLFKTSLNDVFYNDDLITDKLINRYYELYLREGNRQAFIDRVRNMVYTDPKAIKTIENRTLILWGKYDEWIPVAMAHQFYKDLPNARLTIYDNAGHVPMEEIPQETVQDVIAFLEEIDLDVMLE